MKTPNESNVLVVGKGLIWASGVKVEGEGGAVDPKKLNKSHFMKIICIKK